MRQAVLVGEREFEVRDVALPIPQQDEILVQVSYVGICGSDVHVYLGHHPKVKAPVVLGHECVGTIYSASKSSELVAGTPVAIMPLIGCGHCVHCLLSQPNICLNRQVIGFQRPGGLADILRVPATNVVPLPSDFDLRRGALHEPLAVAIHATSLTKIVPGQPVAITGAGTIGLLIGLSLRETYGAEVCFVEINQHRIALAKDLGFQAVGTVADLNTVFDAVHRSLVFECTGRPDVVESVLDLVPAPSELVLVGTFERTATVGLHIMCRFETKIVGSQMYTMADVRQAVKILSSPAGERYEKLLVNTVFPLEHVREAFEESMHLIGGVKVQIKVN